MQDVEEMTLRFSQLYVVGHGFELRGFFGYSAPVLFTHKGTNSALYLTRAHRGLDLTVAGQGSIQIQTFICANSIKL